MVDRFRIQTVHKGAPRTGAERNMMFRTHAASFKHSVLLRDEGKGGGWPDVPCGIATLMWIVGVPSFDTLDVVDPLAELGRTPMAALTYRGRRNDKKLSNILQLPLQHVYSRVIDGRVLYNDILGEYELGFVTFPGARGKIIDGCSMAYGINDSLTVKSIDRASNGIDMLRHHLHAMHSDPDNFYDAPQLPHIFVGFSRPDVVQLAGQAVKEAAARIAGVSADMTEFELQQLLRSEVSGKSVRQGLFVAPGAATNTTNKWLIRHEYLSYIGDNVPLYEDFTSLCGIMVENPAAYRNKRLRVHNPAWLAAQNARIDLKQLRIDYAKAVRGSHNKLGREQEDDITDDIAAILTYELIPNVRKLLGRLSRSFSDTAIMNGLMSPNEPLEQVHDRPSPPVSDAEKLDYGFGFIASKLPHLLGRITPDDMLQAFENPNQRLYARHACVTQHVRLDKFGHARYSATQLGCPRVTVDAL